MHSYLKIMLITVLALTHSLASICVAMAQYDADSQLHYAQGGSSVDVEPPLIEHEVVAESEADIRQTFIASVVDDEELDRVLFFYRFAGETNFSRYTMMQVSFSSTYIAQIPTDPKNLTAIEYYIQARDTSGNRTVRGYTFSPLVRQIVPPAAPDSSAAGTTGGAGASGQQQNDGSTPATSGFGNIPKAVYIAGGVLLLGLLASAASSSGDDSDPQRECGAAGCRLTLTVTQPF